jgi:NDP-sugar pyrophosphorylase family protein
MEAGAVLILGSGSDDAGIAGGADVLGNCATPQIMLDVLGEPVLYRLVESLHQSGVGPICLIVDDELFGHPVIRKIGRSRVQVISSSSEQVGTATQRALEMFKERGLRTAIIMRAAAYVELDVADMVRFHRAGHQRITFVRDGVGRLDMTVVDCSCPSAVSTSISRGWSNECGSRDFRHNGYTNRMRTAEDFRRLVHDALLRRCRIKPNGVEVKHGIWMGANAHLHPRARVVGPAYIGANTRLRAGALVTRCASVERDCEVSCGCVVEDSRILPRTI